MGREEIAIGPLRHCRCKRARRLHRWMRGSPWAIWPSFIRQRDRETVLWFVQTNASSSSPPWTSCDGEWKLLSRGRQSSRVLFPSCPLMSLSHDFPSSLTFPLPPFSLSLSLRFALFVDEHPLFASHGTSRKRWNGRSPMMFMNERSCDCAPSNWLPKVVHGFEGYFLSELSLSHLVENSVRLDFRRIPVCLLLSGWNILDRVTV